MFSKVKDKKMYTRALTSQNIGTLCSKYTRCDPSKRKLKNASISYDEKEGSRDRPVLLTNQEVTQGR